MLHSTNELERYSIAATDGAIGCIKDFYFDDETWTVRYLVVDTSVWLPGRKVLISPMSIDRSRPMTHSIPISITKEQVRSSPSVDTHRPLSRRHEITYLGFYGYPYYWGGSGIWGPFAYPGMLAGSAHGMSNSEYQRVCASAERTAAEAEQQRLGDENPHLRSCNAINHYRVHASDGDLGHLDGFLIDEDSWSLRYLIVTTSNWWFGYQVLIAPGQIGEVSWAQKKVNTGLSRQAIQDAPTYDPPPAA
jgi:hypothetical protein